MTAEIIPLQQAKEEREPHLSGKARCLACKHEWIAVAPMGVTWLECPACSLERGRYVAQVKKEVPHWHCDCGNNLFYVTENGYYCPNCGLDQTGF
jgi:Zn finger protein HypA/HybF involved in hydrogenase expression